MRGGVGSVSCQRRVHNTALARLEAKKGLFIPGDGVGIEARNRSAICTLDRKTRTKYPHAKGYSNGGWRPDQGTPLGSLGTRP